MRFWIKGIGVVLRWTLPVLTLVASIAVAQWLIATKPAPIQKKYERPRPAVKATRVEKRQVVFAIRSQGTVAPQTESTLAAQVSGRIVAVADCFKQSGFFRKDDLLVQIDPRDYRVSARRLEAALESARARQVESERDFTRQRELRERNASSAEDFDHAQASHLVALARVAELSAELEQARHNEADTRVLAPFGGCIREKHVDLGQYVTVGTPLATCFATDAVEVRLPVDDEVLAFLGLPVGTMLADTEGPEVMLSGRFAGQQCRWRGKVVRSEALVDPRSRMAYLVARVSKPYDAKRHDGGQPLAVGMFVEAAIRCQPIADAIVLPEACVSSDGSIWRIDAQDRLEPRTVEVVQRQDQCVIVRGNLPAGSKICATRLEHAVAGVQVEIVGETSPLLADHCEGVLDLSNIGAHTVNNDQTAGSEAVQGRATREEAALW